MKIVEIVKANPKAAIITTVVLAGTVVTVITVNHVRKTIKAKKEALPEAQDSESDKEETEE